MRPALKLLSLNVNGLRDANKRRTLFTMLNAGRWDVVALQETHHVSDAEGESWAASGSGPLHPWPGVSFWSHGTSASRGVALLIKHGCLASEVALRSRDESGRCIVVDFIMNENACSVASVYAPVERQDRCTFFTGVVQPVLPHDRLLLVGGDYNCVADAVLDQCRSGTATNAAPRTVGYAGGLDVVEAAHDLVDVWRHQHELARVFTHVAANGHGTSAARLDRWLVSSPLLAWSCTSDIALGLPGDHVGVCMSMSAPDAVCRGPGPWSFPLPLLHEDAFCAALKLEMQSFLAAHAIGPDMSHAQRWDSLKVFVRDYTQAHSFTVGRQRRAERLLLERVAARAMASAAANQQDPNALHAFRQAQARLQALHDREAKLAALKAGVAWQHYGEQSTYYFYHLAKQRARASEIPSLLHAGHEQPMPLTSLSACQTAGLHLQSAFSSDSPTGLFAPRPVDTHAQATLLASVTRTLSHTASLHCEGPPDTAMTSEELTSALLAMPHGKRPGSDGLPYEFYVAFWEVLKAPLLDVWVEAFAGDADACLPSSMRKGLIALLFKGAGSRSDVASYRPITLLNADYKIIAKALATRFGDPLNAVIDPTQTAFLPHRWIGDNVLSHLEEIDYLAASEHPGCILFLDFAKAYDRLDRHWTLQCMQTLGFGPQAVRCAGLMQTGTEAAVLFNGWRSPSFAVRNGIPQGSPLSPLLYVIAAQPLSSLLTAQAAAAVFHCISYPDGTPAPPCHQHADDTTLHVRTRHDAAIALDGPIALFCAASGSDLNRAKTQGLLFGSEAHFEGLDEALGVTFSAHAGQVRHLGVFVGHDAAACSQRMYDRIISGLRMRVGHWAARRLSFLGRAHVAKQVLGASLWYHATFVRPSGAQLERICAIIMTFVAGGDVRGGRIPPLFPNRTLSSLDWAQGGVRLIDVDAMICALQAKLVARLLEPEFLPWKQFFAQWLHRSAQCRAITPTFAMRDCDRLGYGMRLVFTTFPLTQLGMPARQLGYLTAFQTLRPHRAAALAGMSVIDIAQEPLFYSPRITDQAGSPLQGDTAFALAEHGVACIGSLFVPIPASLPEGLQHAVGYARECLPHVWLEAMQAAGPANLRAEWYTHPHMPAMAFHVQQFASGFAVHAFSVGLCNALDPLDSVPRMHSSDLVPAHVTAWDPARAYRSGPVDADAQAPSLMQYLVQHIGLRFSPALWSLGDRPLPDFIVREACQRRVQLRCLALHPSFAPAQPVRPAIWEDDWADGGVPALGIRAREARWSLGVARAPATVRAARDWEPEPAAWQRQSRPRPLPPRRVFDASISVPAVGPATDVLQDPLSRDATLAAPPWSPVWRRLVTIELDREHRTLAWRILHGSVLCGAFRAYVHRGSAEHAACPHAACMGSLQTLSHLFVTCSVAAPVWAWIAGLMACLPDCTRPPLTVSVLLADDSRVWKPPAALQPLWLRVRLATLHALWCEAAKARRGGPVVSARAVACRVLAYCRKLMVQHWMRVGLHRRDLGGCPQWLLSRDPSMSVGTFGQWWCAGTVLCEIVHAGPTPQMQIRWDASWPVPIPD